MTRLRLPGTSPASAAFWEEKERPRPPIPVPHFEVPAMAIELRLCEPVHVPVLLRALQSWHDDDGIPFNPAVATPPLLGLTRNAGLGSVWLIERHGRPVGYALVEFLPAGGFLWQEATLGALYLMPAARQQGVGRAVRRVLRELLTGRGAALVAQPDHSEHHHWVRLASRTVALEGAAA